MEAEEVVADLQVCVNKLKDAEAVALKLQERLIAVQERADAAESQYTAVSMSLEKSKEEVGNLQTWSAELTHENQQLQSQVCSVSPFSPYVYPAVTIIFFNNNNACLSLGQLAVLLYSLLLLGAC